MPNLVDTGHVFKPTIRRSEHRQCPNVSEHHPKMPPDLRISPNTRQCSDVFGPLPARLYTGAHPVGCATVSRGVA